MAWSIGDYNEFLTVVQDAFGMDRSEAAGLYTELRDVLAIGPLTIADLEEYADVASDLVFYEPEYEYELVEAEPPMIMGVDDAVLAEAPIAEADWWDDMLDVGDEIEITAEVHYD